MNLTNLTSLHLGSTGITDVVALENLTNPRNLYLGENCLDVSSNSPARNVIATLEGRGANVNYAPQRDCGP